MEINYLASVWADGWMDGWMQSTPIEILHNDLTLHLFSNDNYPLHVQDSEKRKKKTAAFRWQ